MYTTEKASFLKHQLPALLATLEPQVTGQWGKMKAQHMVEHLAGAIRMAAGQFKVQPLVQGERLEKNYRFLMSDKPFAPNIENPLLDAEPGAFRYATMPEAVAAVQRALQLFFEYYQQNPEARVLNPFFGELNYEEQVHLLYKHALHHLKQFGIAPAEL
ncbi:MAG TPA: hypothetical protein PKD90_03265 [Phnomibacter sp.]|nr:hypothetical protein [Phnomibacter sp.]